MRSNLLLALHTLLSATIAAATLAGHILADDIKNGLCLTLVSPTTGSTVNEPFFTPNNTDFSPTSGLVPTFLGVARGDSDVIVPTTDGRLREIMPGGIRDVGWVY
ncbi:hypothetical protein Cob_v003130 [Colletotrichum orbiculare MAFF 240422]|uniref:Uncharacterized protein n=1 Tax=Colletotrichum orbiculare (strain 104-T / ATCC 96160 / CBS 514.97 / LARS 414 / MAFF 240422) TaxID=1213857 RepID=N4VAA7_COLOR|nr:hypothetical protein Cob_v003130 [Colletotrichum orbiculare MAFF 240422]